jgi:hypothetical protein
MDLGSLQKTSHKYIFSYWDHPNPTEFVKLCKSTWEKWNPDYKVVLLNKKTVHKWIVIPKLHFIQKSKQVFADVVRVLLIEKYGGYWVDSTVIAYCKFDSLLRLDKNLYNWDFFGYFMPGFTTDPRYPVIENWFFGAKPNSPFITMWKNVFLSLDKCKDSTEYYKNMQKQGVDLQNIKYLDYLSMHIAAQHVLQKSNQTFNMHTLKATSGPFRYLKDAKWDSAKAINMLINNRCYKKTLVKIRGIERKIIEDNNIKLESLL